MATGTDPPTPSSTLTLILMIASPGAGLVEVNMEVSAMRRRAFMGVRVRVKSLHGEQGVSIMRVRLRRDPGLLGLSVRTVGLMALGYKEVDLV